MPIIDRGYGRSRKQFRVPKSSLDPFGGKRQAENVVKRRGKMRGGPNTTGLGFDTREAENAYIVEAEARGLGDMAPGFQRARQVRAKDAGQPDHAQGDPDRGRSGKMKGHSKGGKGTETKGQPLAVRRPRQRSSGMQGQGEGGSFDLTSSLQTQMSKPELVAEHGGEVPKTATEEDLAIGLAQEKPLESRGMVGRF